MNLDLLAFSKQPLMAVAPSWVAGTDARLPRKEPIGVRTALTITTSYSLIRSMSSIDKNNSELTLRFGLVEANRCWLVKTETWWKKRIHSFRSAFRARVLQEYMWTFHSNRAHVKLLRKFVVKSSTRTSLELGHLNIEKSPLWSYGCETIEKI